MENVTALKNERKLTKQIATFASNITVQQLLSWLLCFLFTRANFFGVLKPFTSAFYVSIGFKGISKVFAIVFITLGNVLFSNFYETVRQTLALLLFEALAHMVYRMGSKKETSFNRAAMMSVIVGFTGILRGLMQGLHLYDILVSFLCAALVFSFSVVLVPASETFKKKQKQIIDGKTLFAKGIVLGIAIISLEEVVLWNCEVGTILAGLAVMMIARRKGSSAGACAGAILGMLIAIYDSPLSLEIPGMLALAGAVTGLPVRTKTMSVTLWTLVVVLFSGLSILSGGLTLKYYEILVSGILYLLIPQRLISLIGDELAGIRSRTEFTEAFDLRQTHEAADRLYVLSKALSRVSRSIEETVLEDLEENNKAADWIIEAVAEKVCNRCSFCERCWRTHFINTYKLVEKSLTNLKVNEAGRLEIPGWFRNTCTKPEKFFEALEGAYSVYKTESVWRKTLNESRMLLAKQASIVSGSVLSMARNIMGSSKRDYVTEGRLLTVANDSGLPVFGFRCYMADDSKPCLEAVFETKNKLNARDLDKIVQENVQSDFFRMGESRRDIMGYSVVRYMKKPRFKTATGIARASRENNVLSGDNFAFFISADGYHISAVSDGMGSGSRAERFSRTAVQILESIIEDGIDIGLAIRLLNLYLNLRGDNERLATMDICAIDLSCGETSFYKYGAPASFIKGKYGTEVINAGENDTENFPQSHFKPAAMAAGDFVIMVSDGILEAFSNEGETTGLQLFIDKLDTVNTQQIADSILNEAINLTGGRHDDLTILATKLW